MGIAWGTFAYGLAAGVFVGLAMVFFLNGTRRRRYDPLMTSLGCFSLAVGAGTIVTLRLHRSTEVSDYADWMQFFGVVSLVGLVAFVVLVAVWTSSVPRIAMVAFGAATVVVAVLQLVLPNGLLVGKIDGLRTVELFGEEFVVHEGSASVWRPVLDVYLFGMLVLVVVAIVRGYRLGRRTHSLLMAVTLGVTIVVSYYDSLVDLGRASTPYLSTFGLLGPAIAGAVYLAHRSVQNELRLVDQTRRLEEIVVERTAALMESNRRLEGQLAGQRARTRNLTALAERFEGSNSIVEPTPEAIHRSLVDLLADLGSILGADRVEVCIDDEVAQTTLPPVTTWIAPDDGSDRSAGTGADGTVAGDIVEAITIGERTVGRLSARIAHEPAATDSTQYLGLTAEHLAGLLQRLELTAQIADSAIEGERQRIAMELHDSVTQRMYSVAFLADAAVHQASLDGSDDGDDETARLVRRIRELILASLAELRVLLLELRPHSLVETEMPVLLEQLADNFAGGCDADIVVTVSPTPDMSITQKSALYRICQEALSNACRHADADEITITIENDHGVVLTVGDDGNGFDPQTVTRGSGLDNLRSRADAIGADLTIVSRPGSGTTIEVRLGSPVAPVTEAPTVPAEASHA